MLAMLLLQSSADQAASDAAASALCGGFGLLYAACWGIGILFFIATFVFWIMMLIDCFQRDESEFPNSSGNSKTIWLIVLFASWFIGSLYWLAAVIYYFMVKRAAPRGKGKTTPPPAPPEAPAS